MLACLKKLNTIRNLALPGLVLAITLGLGAAIVPATAHEVTSGDLTLVHPHAFASIGKAGTGAVFVKIVNKGPADRLVDVEYDQAARAELHTHLHENGRMKMRQVDGIDVPAGGEAVLQPGGDHIMLMGLNAALKSGEMHALVLVFRDAGRVPVDFIVVDRK